MKRSSFSYVSVFVRFSAECISPSFLLSLFPQHCGGAGAVHTGSAATAAPQPQCCFWSESHVRKGRRQLAAGRSQAAAALVLFPSDFSAQRDVGLFSE